MRVCRYKLRALIVKIVTFVNSVDHGNVFVCSSATANLLFVVPDLQDKDDLKVNILDLCMFSFQASVNIS